MKRSKVSRVIVFDNNNQQLAHFDLTDRDLSSGIERAMLTSELHEIADMAMELEDVETEIERIAERTEDCIKRWKRSGKDPKAIDAVVGVLSAVLTDLKEAL